MGEPVALRNASDAYVVEQTPSVNVSTTRRIYTNDGTGSGARYGYIYFGVPSGMRGTTILSAKLRLYSGDGFAGSVTATVTRLGGRFDVNRVNWTNKPAVTGTAVALTKTGAPVNTLWEFDVAALMQTVANGGAWYGFRIITTNATPKWFHSAQSTDLYRPELEITWSDAPDPPDGLKPDGGRAVSIAKPTLQWNFTDPSGDTSMASYNLRLFSSLANANANTTPTLDTTVASTVPEVDLDSTSYAGLAVAGTLWWRVRVQDGAGLWSGWSDVASFTRVSKGTLTVTNPAAGGSPFVSEPTPPINWTFTGTTQAAYQVIISTPEFPATWLWTSGKVTGTALAVTPPPGVIKETGKTYRLTVRVWDSASREAVADDPIYTEVVRDFVYALEPTVSGVTGLAVAIDAQKPWATLTWSRATAPDSFIITRNNVVVEEVLPATVLVSGTNYSYIDKEAVPRRDHTWRVMAKVNGQSSATNPTVIGRVKAITTILSAVDSTRMVYLFNPEVSADRVESSEVQLRLGTGPPILITQSIRGFEGEVRGMIVDDVITGVTALDQLAHLEYFKVRPGTILRLTWVDQVIRCVIRNVTHRPVPYPTGKVEYMVGFDFFEDF